ncbi:MAG: hypothetical protein M1839_005708 [Geoglossum umbratile]|nr:MAG: hypothetical protein M1839_005708 [Geoglossum umbratile]
MAGNLEAAGLAFAVVSFGITLSQKGIDLACDLANALRDQTANQDIASLHTQAGVRRVLYTALGRLLKREVERRESENNLNNAGQDHLGDLESLGRTVHEGLDRLENKRRTLDELAGHQPSGRDRGFLLNFGWFRRDLRLFKETITLLDELSEPLILLLCVLSGAERSVIILAEIRECLKLLNEENATVEEIMNTIKEIRNPEIKDGMEWTKSQLLDISRAMEISQANVKWDNCDKRRVPAICSTYDRNRTVASQQQCFIEWKPYDPAGKKYADASITAAQVAILCRYLGAPIKPTTACVPECLGYFHDFSGMRFGILFSVSSHSVSTTTSKVEAHVTMPPLPTSLYDLLCPDRVLPPTAGQNRGTQERLGLALALTIALYTLHSCKVLHKGLRSSNVLFFHTNVAAVNPLSPTQALIDITKPTLSGFIHSRHIEGLSEHVRGKGYEYELMTLPPEYLGERAGEPNVSPRYVFHPEYDLVGLGLTLLEIGRWQRLEFYWDQWGCKSTADFHLVHGNDLQRLVEDLKDLMGQRYYELVKWCLQKGAHKQTGGSGWLTELNWMISLLDPSPRPEVGRTEEELFT